MDKKDYWLWMAMEAGCRFNTIHKLMESFRDIEAIYRASENGLKKGGATEKEAELIIRSREKFDEVAAWKKLADIGIKFVCVEDDEYPECFKKYEYSPYFLFYKGSLPKESMSIVAMVGARACSNYGRVIAKEIGKRLSENGVQIISGMARGIDTFSHVGAVNGGTPTFAVLGCGVDICYPTENIGLYEDIIAGGGGIISEYPPGTAPLAKNFPMRNRIISGYADKIAVIEAKEKSGSLITVEWALEQGKDIYAVPGRVNDVLSVGCNRLIKIGAGVLTRAEDILSDLGVDTASITKIHRINEKLLEKDLLLVYIELGLHPKSVQTIIEETRLQYDKVMGILLKLQFMGLAEETCKNYYVRTNAT